MTTPNTKQITETGLTTDEADALFDEIRRDAEQYLRDGGWEHDGFDDVLHEELIHEAASMIAAVATEEQAVYVVDGDADPSDDPYISAPGYEKVERAGECYYRAGEDGILHDMLDADLIVEWREALESALEQAAGRALDAYTEERAAV
jgi:hypothetical protein